jgi:predicted ATP-binding protein involved in virulence
MRVTRLALRGFRGIADLTLEFPGQVAVLAGVNGSGKSSVLEALAMLLGRLGAMLRESAARQHLPQLSDIRNGATEALLMVETTSLLGKVDWGLHLQRTLDRVARRFQADNLRLQVRALRERLQEEPDAPIPLAVFYRTNRAVLDIPLRIRKRHSFDQFAAFEDALEGGWSSFRLFFEWFREREDLENQERARAREFEDRQLSAVRSAVAELMPDFSDLRVQRVPLRMTVAKSGMEFDLAQLSDGEKCQLAMVADIARRLAIANPSATEPRQAPAVILIDEIELHLHPRWQRAAIPGLCKAFPNCQFLVSTHSPQVLSSLRPESVFLLECGESGVVATRPTLSFGRHSNQILVELMDTPDRPLAVRERLDAMFASIDHGNIPDAKRLRDEIEREIGPDEPELVRADIMLRLHRAPE